MVMNEQGREAGVSGLNRSSMRAVGFRDPVSGRSAYVPTCPDHSVHNTICRVRIVCSCWIGTLRRHVVLCVYLQEFLECQLPFNVWILRWFYMEYKEVARALKWNWFHFLLICLNVTPYVNMLLSFRDWFSCFSCLGLEGQCVCIGVCAALSLNNLDLLRVEVHLC